MPHEIFLHSQKLDRWWGYVGAKFQVDWSRNNFGGPSHIEKCPENVITSLVSHSSLTHLTQVTKKLSCIALISLTRLKIHRSNQLSCFIVSILIIDDIQHRFSSPWLKFETPRRGASIPFLKVSFVLYSKRS